MIAFDSDGCVFDTMELKHKECFCPAVIKHLKAQPVCRAAREVWEFVNLYSRTRGSNRFIALQHVRDRLRERADVRARGFTVPALRDLDAWIARETRLGNPGLEAEVERTGSDELRMILAWTREVNERIADLATGIPPFPGVEAVFRKAQGKADLMVVSQTPVAALQREWGESGLLPFVSLVAGQEHGTKSEHIRLATGGKGYPPGAVLKVGDAPGDRQAAAENGALFFPIVPGREVESWERLAGEGLDRFLGGAFTAAYQASLIEAFDAALPETPPWERVSTP